MATMDLYTLFVENSFGGFWSSLVGLAFVFLLILAFGGVTGFSIGWILIIFFLTMAIGYGHPIVTIPLVIGLIAWALLQWRRQFGEV